MKDKESRLRDARAEVRAEARTEEERRAGEVSRRDFIKGTGLAGVAMSAGVLLVDEPAKAGGRPAGDAKWMGPGAVAVELKINGQARRLELEPRVTLLDALRDRLDLTGAKKVCDRGTCGACTVIVDGKAVYSCTMLAVEAQGREILTIEGLAPEGELAEMSKAFVNNDAQQCGFCTPGFVMACKAYLDHEAKPTYEGVQHTLGGNLCRCGTYMGVRRAVLEAAGVSMKGGEA
jgi:xanthine dehydrogenase YagT iron-sulfur-binding subunit